MSPALDFNWHKAFKGGRGQFEKDYFASASQTHENLEKVRELRNTDCRQSVLR